jgi:hypothetical protein
MLGLSLPKYYTLLSVCTLIYIYNIHPQIMYKKILMYDKNLCKYCNSEADLSALVTDKVKIYTKKEREERERTGCPTTMMISWLTTRTTIWSTRRIRTRVINLSNVSVVNPFLYNSVSDPHWCQYGTGSSILPQC